MKAQVAVDQLTNRLKGLALASECFEEQRFLGYLTEILLGSGGTISLSTPEGEVLLALTPEKVMKEGL